MNKNPLTLLGNTFSAVGYPNIGNCIEVMLGGTISPSHNADLGNWEIKSRNKNAKAWVSLGSKKTENVQDVVEQVYRKIKNVILIEYVLNDDKTFTVTDITIMYELERESLNSAFGVYVKPENRHGIITLRVKGEKFSRLYGKKVIQYKAD